MVIVLRVVGLVETFKSFLEAAVDHGLGGVGLAAGSDDPAAESLACLRSLLGR
jgi:hypothetical protein